MLESRHSSDWVPSLDDPFRENFCSKISELGLQSLSKYPVSRRGRPIGHEHRVLYRVIRGRNVQFEVSMFSQLYRAFASKQTKTLFRGFVLGEPLFESEWSDLLGSEATREWREHALFDENKNTLRCRFRAFSHSGLVFLSDPRWVKVEHPVYIGRDSIIFSDFIDGSGANFKGTHLDVGTGTGIAGLASAKRYDSVLMVDINPRAVAVAGLNATINGLGHCHAQERDVFSDAAENSRFDLVTWNLPLLFLPESERGFLAGFGGEKGIELTLKFVAMLPDLLSPSGMAVLGTSSPILFNRTNLLETRLREFFASGYMEKFDFVLYQLERDFSHPKKFHRDHGIHHFLLSMLKVVPGQGTFHLRRVPVGQRGIDSVRAVFH